MAYANLLQIQINVTGVKINVASNGLPFMLTWADALASDGQTREICAATAGKKTTCDEFLLCSRHEHSKKNIAYPH